AVVGGLAGLLAVPADIAALGRELPSTATVTVTATPTVAATPPSTSTRRRAAIAAAAQRAGLTPDPLLTPVEHLHGVGPSLGEKLRSKGLGTVHDLLLNLPRRYEDRRN